MLCVVAGFDFPPGLGRGRPRSFEPPDEAIYRFAAANAPQLAKKVPDGGFGIALIVFLFVLLLSKGYRGGQLKPWMVEE